MTMFGWKSREKQIEYLSPWGEPMSEYDSYKFEPLDDITPLEVALIVACIGRARRWSDGWPDCAHVKRDEPPREWPQISRHFRKIDEEKESVS